MSNKYLKLRFEDASLFKRSRDRYNKDKVAPKITGQKFKEPITVYHISNMIHVLFSERPVPTVRDVRDLPYEVNQYYFKKAQDSLIHIDNVVFKNSKGEEHFQREIMNSKKMKFTSWVKDVTFNWFRLKAYLGEEYYDTFRNLCFEEMGIDDTVSMREVVSKIDLDKQPKIKAFLEELQGLGKKMLYRCLMLTPTSFNQLISPGADEVFNLYGVNVINGVETKTNLSGYIYVPVSEPDIEKLENGKGTATLLDGGLVTIEGIEDVFNIDANVKLVSELSTELTQNKTK